MYYVGETLKIREKTLYQIYTEEAEFYFEREEGGQYWESNGFEEEDAQEWRDFNDEFEVVNPDALASEDFYQGVTYMFVVKRKVDNKLFGLTYFYSGGKYGESYFTEEHDGEVYTLSPVRPSLIQSYKFEDLK